jgi:hypothetical protein
MATKTKAKEPAPRKRLTSERPLKHRPPDKEDLTVPAAKRLPGMEDSALEDLESAARTYAKIRDRRMALNQDEAELKDKLLSQMKHHGKTTYKHDGVEIKIVVTEEKVRVKITEDED